MKKFFSSECEVKSYSPLDSQISSADFSLVINFPHKIFVPSKPATLQLSKMVWHLKIGQKLRVLGAKTWGVMFFQNFWLKLKGAILGPQNHFWWFQRQNGGFPNGYFGFLKKKLKSESAILRIPNSCSCVSSPPAVLPKSELRKDFFCIFTEFKGWEPFDINSKTNWPSQNEGYLNAMFFAGLIF